MPLLCRPGLFLAAIMPACLAFTPAGPLPLRIRPAAATALASGRFIPRNSPRPRGIRGDLCLPPRNTLNGPLCLQGHIRCIMHASLVARSRSPDAGGVVSPSPFDLL